MIKEEEKNLSLTEYRYYHECPQKFRILRILNPMPETAKAMGKKRTYEQYLLRGYTGAQERGIAMHQFMETFHEKYEEEIAKEEEETPEEILQDPWKKNYWERERKRYQETREKNAWKPYKKEWGVMTKKQRGIIDCLEWIAEGKLRLMEYKPRPKKSDKETLVFYAQMLKDYQKEQEERNAEGEEEPLQGTIDEIGCYYYQTGGEWHEKIEQKQLEEIVERIEQIREEITKEKFPRRKEACENCPYEVVCKIEKLRER